MLAPDRMVACPRCRTPNPDQAQFCAGCGHQLATGAMPPPDPRNLPRTRGPERSALAADSGRQRAIAPTLSSEESTMAYEPAPSAGSSPRTEVTLGRDPGCTVVIDNPVVSARHARITRAHPSGLAIEDLGSTNGTYVNGTRITRATITFRDDVHLGSAPIPILDGRIVGLVMRMGRRVAPGEPVAIGSGAGADLIVESSEVAPRHAEVVVGTDGIIEVRDLGAAPTFIDGPHFPVRQARLSPNSVLILNTFPIPNALLVRMLGESASTAGAIAAAVTANVNLSRDIVRIGRAPDNDLVLPHPTVSGRHARLLRQPDGSVRVEDLGSTNGTFVGGERVTAPVIVRPGQQVSVGAVALTIGSDGRVAAASRASVRLDLMGMTLIVPDRGTGRPKTLLDRVSMSIFPGELVGMLGPSGAGKSTLLMSVLGLYRPTGGGVLLNGRPLYAQYESFRTNVGYVPQDDIVHPQLTVREALRYACKLRLPAGTRRADLEASIDQTLKQVGLWEQRDLQIGSPEEKVLSGGQRRRVNLAVELVTDPSLLILDEPTSGLSWTDAADVIATLRRLADEGRTIVLTIHQPDYQEYEKFDTVAILGKGGKLLFFGPPTPDSYQFFGAAPSKPREMFDHVENMPADEWRARFEQSPTFQRFVAQRAPGAASGPPAPPPRPRPRSSLRQFPVLLGRSSRLTLRNRTALALLLIQAPLLGLLIGLTTSGAATFAAASFGCRDTTADFGDACAEVDERIACDPEVVSEYVAERAAAGEEAFSDVMERWRDSRVRDPRTGLLAVLMALFLPMIIASSNVLVSERTIYERERLAGLNIVPYVLARFLVLAVLGGVVTSLNLMVALPLLELRGHPFWYWVVGVMVTSAASAIGLALSAAVRNPVSALWGINFLVIPQLLFAGSITRLTGITWAASWLTTTRYALEALANIDLRARGHLRACQVERYLENYPGFMSELSMPVAYAAAGTGTITLACVMLTMFLLWIKDKRVPVG